MNYADDIVLLFDEIRQARQLLRNGNIECNKDQSYVYINFESVEIETIDGKKSKQTVVESKRQGSKPQIPGKLDMFLGKRHKSPHSTGLAITKQSEQHLEESLCRKKRRKLFRATKETILFYRSDTCSLRKKEAWVELIQECCKCDKHTLEE